MRRLDTDSLAGRAWLAFRQPLLAAVLIGLIGAVGYRNLSAGTATWVDCAYMTWITVTTIGYGEVIDLSQNPGGRIFTMVIGTAGIANFGYFMTKLTVFIVESSLDEVLRRRKMQDRIQHMKDHYIVCGIGRVGSNVVHELASTGRPLVAIDESAESIANYRERHPGVLALHGDARDEDLLGAAGIAHARGLFAITGDDGTNLLITLSAKQLNPAARVVARCHDVRNIEKLRRLGADAIVSPDFTGGMRIAASMLRPTVVGFLDEMLRSDEKLRVEEVHVPPAFTPRRLGDAVPASPDYIVLAVRSAQGWHFNPRADFTLACGNTLVAMATPAGRRHLEQALRS